MQLNDAGLKDRQAWEEKGYSLPQYDREAVRKATKENPFWIHFGGGNIFRAFQANVVQNLLKYFQGIPGKRSAEPSQRRRSGPRTHRSGRL